MEKFPTQYRLLNKYLFKMAPLRTPLIGQDATIFSMEAALYKKSMSNIILLAEAGQGKSALTQYFAQLNEKILTVYEVSLSALHGEDKNLGTRLNQLLDELIDYKRSTTDKKDVVLFFDEMHQLPLYSLEAVESIKPKLARGAELGIHIIGATTYMEYTKYIKPNPALTTRFQQIIVPELSRELIHQILISHLPEYGIKHTKEVDLLLFDVIDYSNLAMPAESQPRKALDVLDTMYGRRRARQVHGQTIPFDRNLLSDVIFEKSRYRINFEVDAENLQKQLGARVFDQQAAVSILSDYAFASILNIQNENRPRGTFLFVGPTGVGKTELAKSYTETLFGKDAQVARFDMGEFQTKESVPIFQKRLTDKVLTAGYPILLLDEIEKAHPDVSTLLYAVLDEAKMSDEDGREVSFANHFIVLTTNVGEDAIGKYSNHDMSPEEVAEAIKDMERTVQEALQNAVNFPQAFLGRLSAIVPFAPLTLDTLRKIATRSLITMKEKIETAQPVRLDLDMESLLTFVLNEKTDLASSAGGARQIGKIVEQQVRNKIAAPIVLNRKLNRFHVTMSGDTITGDQKRRKSRAYVNVRARAVNEAVILQHLAKVVQDFKQKGVSLSLDKDAFMETMTVDPVDFTHQTDSQVDQTEVCLRLLGLWERSLRVKLSDAPKSKIIRTEFKPDPMSRTPFTLIAR